MEAGEQEYSVEPSVAMSGLAALPELIRRLGTRRVFAMLGETNVGWVVQGLEDGAFELVKTRHEDTAMNAAAGYTRVTGELGICTVTRGPGFTNAVNALTAATQSHFPALLIAAESPASRVRSNQNIAQEALVAAIGAGFHHVADGTELEATFFAAAAAARFSGIPQVLSIGDGVLEGAVPLTDRGSVVRAASEVDPDAVRAAVDVLVAAQRPLIVAGQGAVLASCRADLERLATLAGARVANTMRANSYFSGVPGDLGLCGSWASQRVREELATVDVVLGVGASLNSWTLAEGTLFAGAKIIHCEIDVEQPCLATSPELALFGDARDVVRALVEEWEGRGIAPPSDPVRTLSPEEIRGAVLDVDLGHDPSRGLDPRRVYTALDAQLPADRIVVTDVGRFIRTLPTLLPAQDAESWIVGQGHGSVGLGLGLAIGAAAGCPGRSVVLVCGDGGFMMTSHDLDSVVVNGLDLTIVVVDDEQLGQEARHLRAHGLPLDVLHSPMPDVPTLARALGGRGHVISTEDDLAGLPLDGRAGLRILDMRVDPEVDLQAVYS